MKLIILNALQKISVLAVALILIHFLAGGKDA